MSQTIIQQLDRFQGAHRYHGKQPLRELVFSLSIWRAPLIEEDRRELLCETKFVWGAKVPSPKERLEDVQQWVRSTATRPAVGGVVAPNQQPQGGDVEMVRRTSTEFPMGFDGPSGGHDVPRHPTIDLVASLPVAPDAPSLSLEETASGGPQGGGPIVGSITQKMVQFCERGDNLFFTRPPSEDYVDPTEFISPLEPEQATSPLAAIVLSNHRSQHRGNPNMYLMWAVGRATVAPLAERGRAWPRGADTALAAQLPMELLDVAWAGSDVVFCTITRQANSDTSFLCKPSLNDEHTLLVTSKHIYSFQLSVVQAAATTNSTTAIQLGAVLSAGVTPRYGMAGSPNTNQPLQQETPSRIHVDRLIAGSGDGSPPADLNGQLYITNATERQRRVLLRQAVLRGGKASRHGNHSDVGFTPPPQTQRAVAPVANGGAPSEMEKPVPMVRVHYFGTLETTLGVHVDSLVLRFQWILPEGVVVESTLSPTGAPVAGASLPPQFIISQLAFGCRILNADYMYDTQHTFNIPFELTVMMPASNRRCVAAAVTAFTRGNGGDDYAEPAGYGAVWFSSEPGMHMKQSFGLWKPRKTGYEFLRSVFLGGGPALPAEEILSLVPNNPSGSFSKVGMVCESSGTIQFGYSVVTQSAAVTSVVGDGAEYSVPPSVSTKPPLGSAATLLLRPATPPPSSNEIVGEFDPTQRSLSRAANRAGGGNGGMERGDVSLSSGGHRHHRSKHRSSS